MRSWVPPRLLLAPFTIIMVAQPARSQVRDRASVRLLYQGGSECPGEVELRRSVSARLGYDPFDLDGGRALETTVEATQHGLTALVQMIGADGSVIGERNVEAADCAELADVLELTIAIAIDPLAAAGTSAVPAPTAPDSPPEHDADLPTEDHQTDELPFTARPHVDNATTAPTPKTTPFFELGLGIHASLGVVPKPSPGVRLRAGVVGDHLEFHLEGRVEWPMRKAISTGGEIDVSLIGGAILPCLRRSWFRGCLVTVVGALRARALEIEQPRQVEMLALRAGARVGGSYELGRRISLGIHVEVLASLIRTSFEVDQQSVWTTPPVSGLLGIEVTVAP